MSERWGVPLAESIQPIGGLFSRIRAVGFRRWIYLAIGLLVAWWLVGKLTPPTIETVLAERRLLVQSVVATGRVRSLSKARLGLAIGGTVARVAVREGDRVAAGQLLVELDAAESRAQLAQARANLAQAEAAAAGVSEVRERVAAAALRAAEAAYEKASADYRRTNRLVEAGATAPEQLETAHQLLEAATSQRDIAAAQQKAVVGGGSDLRAAEAQIAQAKAAVSLAEARLANTRVLAPGPGRVLTRDVEPGDAVQAGRILMTVALDGLTQLVAVPDEKDVARLRVGQPAIASADAFPGQSFAARVSYVAPAIDPDQGTVEVRLDVDEPPDYLRPDLTVSVQIETARRPDALVAPLEAIREAQSGKPWAAVVEGGRIVRRELTLGVESAGAVEVLAGLSPGEAVVPQNRSPQIGSRVRSKPRPMAP